MSETVVNPGTLPESDYTHNRADAAVHSGSYLHHPAPHLMPAPIASDAAERAAVVKDDGEPEAE